MIQLHQFPKAFGLPNPSPFCVKVETYLRLAGLEYEIVEVSNPSKAPKGKCPFIVDGDTIVADSHFILAYLKRKYGDPLGEGLSDVDRAYHHAIARMIEDHLYFPLLYTRWVLPENADIVRDQFFGSMPKLVRGVIFGMVQKSTRKRIESQGCGGHERHEIEQLAIEDINALSTILGDDDFFGGDTPREIDCVAWGTIANTLVEPFATPIKDAAAALPNLVAYSARMKARIFPGL